VSAPTAKRQPIPFGKYLLLDRVNIGGMAEVWRAKIFGTGGTSRLVAIKRILPNIAEDEDFIAMFIDEAKITVQLHHLNIAKIEELAHQMNSYFIVMEYVSGRDLRALFDRCRKNGEPAPVALACFVLAQAAEGLAYAHRAKDHQGREMDIVHRDVSPQNVLVSYAGEVKVIDFGIAKAANKATRTQAGILKGKFGYMSPEQIRGLPIDRRSDVFALGVCLFEVLTGERLFVGESDFSVLEKVRKVEMLPPSYFNKKISAALEKIVLRALAKETSDRYQHANELAADLRSFMVAEGHANFGQADLSAFMQRAFAEEYEREQSRLAEYKDLQAPESMLAASPAVEVLAAPDSPETTGVGGNIAATMPAEIGRAPLEADTHAPEAAAALSESAASKKTAQGLMKSSPSAPPAPPKPDPSPPSVTTSQWQAEEATVFDMALLGEVRPPREPPAAPAITPPAQASAMTIPVPRASALSTMPKRLRNLESVPSPPVLHRAESQPHLKDSDSTPVPGEIQRIAEQVRLMNPDTAHQLPHVSPALASKRTIIVSPQKSVRNEPLAQEASEPEAEASNPDIEAPSQESPALEERPASRWPMVLALMSLLSLVLAAGAFVVFRPVPKGLLVIEIPEELSGQATLNVNGVNITDSKGKLLTDWPHIEPVPAGKVTVKLAAPGYETLIETLTVPEGNEPTSLTKPFKKKVAP
jgi:eukaryotic-like serine/threonine-protein kinase